MILTYSYSPKAYFKISGQLYIIEIKNTQKPIKIQFLEQSWHDEVM